MTLHVFKIKDKNTGLFSTGGYSPRWTKRGKTWSQINHVKTHLRQHCNYKVIEKGKTHWEDKKDYNTYVNNIPKNWIIVEMVASEGKSEVLEYPARTMYPEEFPSRGWSI